MAFANFGTFMIAPIKELSRIQGVGVPRKWRLRVEPDPTRRHWCDSAGRIAAIVYPTGDDAYDALTKKLRLAHHLIIQAHDQATAAAVQSLIHAGAVLTYPDLLQSPEPPGTYSAGIKGLTIDPSESFAEQFHEYQHLGYGCRAAAGAWGNDSLVYALEKFKFSVGLDWFTPHSAHPIYRQKFPLRYSQPAHHVLAAFAIVAAYAVVEELGLEVRSSREKPRFLDPARGTWNPVVLADVHERLRSCGIEPVETFDWIRRGPPTQVEREMKPRLGRPARWNRRFGVRDREVTIADALHQLSWLRNFVAAHKFRVTAAAVSPYDVHNAQGIARRVLLSRLGMWRSHSDSNPQAAP